MRPILGDLVCDRYEVVECLGKGRMSSVFKAWDQKEKRFVVVKFATNNHRDPDLVEYLKREAIALKRLDHPRFARLFDCGHLGESYFLVLEYITGLVVLHCLDKVAWLPPDIAISVMVDVLEGLEVVHSNGMVHRDIKPQNLIITSNGVKIIDFGVVKFIPTDNSAPNFVGNRRTAVGSLPYMSPEEACGMDGVNGRSDLFACGVTLYQMLTGEFPFHRFESAVTSVKSRYWILPFREFSETSAQVPYAVQEIVWKALAVNPDDRYQTAAEMRAALLAVMPSIFKRFLEEFGRNNHPVVTLKPMVTTELVKVDGND